MGIWGDYGTGKSLVVKEKSFQLKEAGKSVIFISLGSCDTFGFPYDLAIIFDILTSEEMAGHDIKFLSAIDLLQHHEKKKKDKKDNHDDKDSLSKSNLEFAIRTVQKRVRG